MKKFVTPLLIITLFAFYRFSYPTPTLCEKIKQRTPKLSNYNFTDEWVKKINLKKIAVLDSALYLKLFDEEKSASDSSFAIGWFDVSPTRLGLICCHRAAECDHRVTYLSLYVIDNCDTVVYRDSHFAYIDDDAPFYFEVSATLSKDKKMFTHVTIHSSEWIDTTVDLTAQDTTFTETYKINLSSPKFDTTSTIVDIAVIKK